MQCGNKNERPVVDCHFRFCGYHCHSEKHNSGKWCFTVIVSAAIIAIQKNERRFTVSFSADIIAMRTNRTNCRCCVVYRFRLRLFTVSITVLLCPENETTTAFLLTLIAYVHYDTLASQGFTSGPDHHLQPVLRFRARSHYVGSRS